MKALFAVLMIAAALSVLASLGIGLFFMVKDDAKRSNQMMRWRVGLQALALALFVIAVNLDHG